jgi:16S rRNA (uracil1498-N3)-methyltransferase
LDWKPDALRLEGAEAHHAIDVLRLKPGGRIVLFDGRGLEATAEIDRISKGMVSLKPILTSRTAPLPYRLVLGQAVPKGKQMDLIVQKATELGVSTIVPLLSERTVVQVESSDEAQKAARWNLIAIEAAKQCGQNWLPDVRTPLRPKSFLENPETCDIAFIGSLQDDARDFRSAFLEHREARGRNPRSAMILIGPEGDFTPAELALAKTAGCIPVSLGPIVLRTETAAIFSLSVLSYELRAD